MANDMDDKAYRRTKAFIAGCGLVLALFGLLSLAGGAPWYEWLPPLSGGLLAVADARWR
jgi:hypothetical protein